MAVGKKISVGSEMKFVQTTTVLGRKRVLPCQAPYSSNMSSPLGAAPLKRQNSGLQMENRSNGLEALPQDILVKILCKVDHSDLKQLLLVSKIIKQATLAAKEIHFAFSTPSKSVEGSEFVEDCEEAPNAPKQQRAAKSRLDGVKLSSIVVSLFASPVAEDE